MGAIASQITSLTIVYSTVYSDADQRKHQSSASLAFVWGTHRDRWFPRTKGQLRGKCFHLMTSSCGPLTTSIHDLNQWPVHHDRNVLKHPAVQMWARPFSVQWVNTICVKWKHLNFKRISTWCCVWLSRCGIVTPYGDIDLGQHRPS